MLDCGGILECCSVLVDMKSIHITRRQMAMAMANIFDVRQIVLLGLDATNEKCVILASLPQSRADFAVDLEQAANSEHPARWAFRQQQTVMEKYDYESPLTHLLKEALPDSVGKKVFLIPCIYADNDYPDLVFLFAAEDACVPQVRIELGMALGRFCANLNRSSLRLEYYENSNRLLSRSLINADAKAKKDQMKRSDELERRIVGRSKNIQEIRRSVLRYGQTEVSVLVLGETGTGKELVAQELHHVSKRRNGPFIAVNVAAIPEGLIESELFGHVKGAFSGADGSRNGLLRQADGGTLFLDEIGDLPFFLQAKLLRVLQERKYRPVGSDIELKVDIRIVAATHRNLKELVQEQKFRSDLFYRLAEAVINLPALKDRPGDIAVLADCFLQMHRLTNDVAPTLSPEAKAYLIRQEFPGNVRQLKSVIDTAFFECDRSFTIDLSHIRNAYSASDVLRNDSLPDPLMLAETQGLQTACEAFEKSMLEKYYGRYEGHCKTMAEKLQIPLRTLYRKLEKYGLEDIKNAQTA